jgi:hypothetical protein
MSHRRAAPRIELPPARTLRPRPRNPLLLIVALLLAQLFAVVAPIVKLARVAASRELSDVYPGLALLLGDTQGARYEIAREKAERSLSTSSS